MIRDMNTHFSPLLLLFTKVFMYKNGVLLPIAAVTSVGIEITSQFLELDFMGVSYSFLFLISFMFLVDFITGVIATKHEEQQASEKGDLDEAKNKEFSSKKINFTFFKFIMLFLWIWLADRIGSRLEGIPYFSFVYDSITTMPLVLVTLREYVSIGENIHRKYNKKPYIFTLVEKIFDAMQGKFIKKMGDED